MNDLERIKDAVALLKNGNSIKVGDVRLALEDSNNMYVTGWSLFSDIENLTKLHALQELCEIKGLVERMIDASSELKDFIKEKHIEYNLGFNYGMGGLGICSEKAGIITWHIELPQ